MGATDDLRTRTLQYKLSWLRFKYSHFYDRNISESELKKRFENNPHENNSYWADFIYQYTKDDVINGKMTLDELDKIYRQLIIFEDLTWSYRANKPVFHRFAHYELRNFIRDYLAGGNKLINAIIKSPALSFSLEYGPEPLNHREITYKERAFTNYIIEQLILSLSGDKENKKVSKIIVDESNLLTCQVGLGLSDIEILTRNTDMGEYAKYAVMEPQIVFILKIPSLTFYYDSLGGTFPGPRETLWYENPSKYTLEKIKRHQVNVNGYKKMLMLGFSTDEIIDRAVLNILIKSLKATAK